MGRVITPALLLAKLNDPILDSPKLVSDALSIRLYRLYYLMMIFRICKKNGRYITLNKTKRGH